MGSTRSLLAVVATIGSLAVAWLAGAAPVWQGFNVHL